MAAPLQLGERALTVLSFLQEQAETKGQVPAAGSSSSNERDAAFASEIERLERELLSSQETLRRSMADLEQANEELEASSEELQASSEELQSSNEELEASNEELQATNEELASLNQQLRIRSDELEHLNNDLENIQSSLSQGMVIVDRNLRITRFSPLAVRVFGLVDSDIGQPLIGMPTTVPLPNLREALLGVLEGKERTSIEASSEEVSYLAQVMPYRDKSGERLGAIITLTDVSELVALRQAAEASLREFAKLADSLEQVVWKRDHGMGRILYISRRIEQLTGWSAAELCSDPSRFDAAIDPEDRARVEAARSAQGSGWNVTYRLLGRDGQSRMLNEVASVVNESNDHYVVGTLSDVSVLNRRQRHKSLLACGLDTLLSRRMPPFALVDQGLRIVRFNAGFAEGLGLGSSHLNDQPLERLASALARPDELVDTARQMLLQPKILKLATSSSQLTLSLQSVVDQSGERPHVVGLLLALDSASAG
jgi:two-component system CheB/CheR fusion protein